jgi:hypothetical protein
MKIFLKKHWLLTTIVALAAALILLFVMFEGQTLKKHKSGTPAVHIASAG